MLSLAQETVIADLADELYNYLPGSSQWGTYTFADAAKEVGVDRYWPGGSKRPAITELLGGTLEHESGKLGSLVERVVRHGIKYRRRQGYRVTRGDVERIIRLVRQLGVLYTALSAETFLESLATSAATATQTPTPEPSSAEFDRHALRDLRDRFLGLQALADRNQAGRALESLLTELFALSGLDPTDPFRVEGEQIDGALILDGAHYLIEAKWTKDPTPEAELLVFRGKIEGKSSFTRGLFISINGFSSGALSAITRGKQPNFVMVDGTHLFRALELEPALPELLRRLVRELAEKGKPYCPVSEW